MPEDRIPPVEARSDHKSPGKHKWGGKLFSADGKFGRKVGDLESTDHDVADFLQTASTKPQAGVQLAGITHSSNTTAASQYPAAAEGVESASVVDVYRSPKPRQNKGLRVTFGTASPDIIGVGGDDAELPSIQVSKPSRDIVTSRLPRTERYPVDVVPDPLQDNHDSMPVPVAEPSSQPSPLPRKSAGLSDIFGDEIWGDKNHDSVTSAPSYAVSPLESKPLPQPQHQIQKLGDYVPRPSPEETHEEVFKLKNKAYDIDEHNADHKLGDIGDHISSHLGVPSPETLAGNSLTPNSSLEPPSGYRYPPKALGTQIRRKPLDSNNSGSRQVTEETSDPAVLESRDRSLRSFAKAFGDDSLDDFDGQVRRFNDIFRLGISAHVDLMKIPFAQWMSISAWWFIMGREGLESEIRNHEGLSRALKQAYVNLAKAWWILEEVTPNHPEVIKYGKASMNSLCAIIKDFGDRELAELAEVHLNLVAHMRALTMSMKRNDKLPPPDLEIRGLDLHVLLHSPSLPLDIATHMVNNSSGPQAKGTLYIAKPFFPILIGDTSRHFSFARMFVKCEILFPDKGRQNMQIPCLLTVLRERNEWGVEVAITSLDSQVNLVVSDDILGGMTWKRIKWEIGSHKMLVRLSADFDLDVKLSEKEFKILWGICDYTQKTRKRFLAQRDEELIFERILERFQCDDTVQFPPESVTDCRLRVFERRSVITDDISQQKAHNGYRLAVITPPNLKTLSSVNYDLGGYYPILFGIRRSKDGSKLVLRILPSSIRLSPTFREAKDLDLFRHLLSGTLITEEDYRSPPLQIRRLTINSIETDQTSSNYNARDLPWSRLRVVNKGPPAYGHNTLPTVGSNHLRILADCNFGTLTDRIDLAPGNLQLSLSVDNCNEIKLLRPPQSDMIWSLADDRVTKEELQIVCDTTREMLTSSTVRLYHFSSMSDLHSFQVMVTGFSVLFDKIVSSFAISRRRMVVPISKRWEASPIRLQVIKQDKAVQLAAFFKDFSHGSCMNFALRFTDMFETFSRTGLFYLRIVDAKFTLPKGQGDQSREFICLDMPEYPSEHDDVTIGFDNEQGMLLQVCAQYLLTPLQRETGLEKYYRLRSIECRGWRPYEGIRAPTTRHFDRAFGKKSTTGRGSSLLFA